MINHNYFKPAGTTGKDDHGSGGDEDDDDDRDDLGETPPCEKTTTKKMNLESP